ncbi:MAG: TGS domain-containing protein [Merdibacter sp.]
MDSIAEMARRIGATRKARSMIRIRNSGKSNELSWFRDLSALTGDLLSDDPNEYMDTLQKDIFEANVYVMTPKGRVIELPNGSTPIDFAYRVHTEVGHSTVGGMVMFAVPLHAVKNRRRRTDQDVRNGGAKRDWLKFVKPTMRKQDPWLPAEEGS